jgi:acetyl-CoA carboxylase carboxyl transferase subunit beta
MAWFKRSKQNISPSSRKSDIPDGHWVKCGECSEIIHKTQIKENAWVCPKCDFHFRVGSEEYIEIICDRNSFRETNKKMRPADPLEFEDTKKYADRTASAFKKTGLYDAVKTGTAKINGLKISFACMDFRFIGGSMGSVVGEKIARAIDRA